MQPRSKGVHLKTQVGLIIDFIHIPQYLCQSPRDHLRSPKYSNQHRATNTNQGVKK